MVTTISIENFRTSDAVIIDVRTPSEFALGHIDGAINLPLFEDHERVVVGTLYKQVGRDAAVEKGLDFVGPKLGRFVREAKKLSAGKTIHLYCWRGGMRSNSMAWLLDTAGLSVVVLEGGYKAYRATFEQEVARPWQFLILVGSTGCGKTDLLLRLQQMGEQVLDLEGLANHRGSVFGGFGLGAQPSTETFINRLHEALRSMDHTRRVWCEGESMLIGKVFIPEALFRQLTQSPYIAVSMAMPLRINRLVKEYGHFDTSMLREAFIKISKRLGPENTKQALDFLDVSDVANAAAIALRYYDKGYKDASAKRSGANVGEIHILVDDIDANSLQLIEIEKTLKQ